MSLGGTLTVTHVKPGKPDYGFRLQTTGFTKMEVFNRKKNIVYEF